MALVLQGLFTTLNNLNAQTMEILSQTMDEVWNSGEARAVTYRWTNATVGTTFTISLVWMGESPPPKGALLEYPVLFDAFRAPHGTNIAYYVVDARIAPRGRYSVMMKSGAIYGKSIGKIWGEVKPTATILTQLSDEVWRPGEVKEIKFSWSGAVDNDRFIMLLVWEEAGFSPKRGGENYAGLIMWQNALHMLDLPSRTNVLRYVVPADIPLGRHRILVNLQSIADGASQGTIWVGSTEIPQQGKIKQFSLTPPTPGRLGSAMIAAEGVPTVPYSLQESEDLLAWRTVSLPQGTPSGAFYFTTVLTNAVTSRFYRLIEVR
ncbi:MAG: hypothetical protein HYW65_04875 [Candidatus Liptonbacteria bacterium]|nr:hypothetical protein [Candidatus Liptonbacteria bacterium]